MAERKISIALVSGKGGVGKTSIASNLSWICSKFGKTILVDIDFQNQGSTGLFAATYKFGAGSAFSALKSGQPIKKEDLCVINESLSFLPTVTWENAPDQKEIEAFCNQEKFGIQMDQFIDSLYTEHGFEIVLLDCHGGVDAVSYSAFRYTDHTLMISEADSVTFAGTLELLNFYENQLKQAGMNDYSPDVKMVINRVPGKYSYKGLERVYSKYMQDRLGKFSPVKSIFCYIPVEPVIADSFGEYPFTVRIGQQLIFSRKIQFIAVQLLKDKFGIPNYKPISRFRKPSFIEKINRKVISNEEKIKNSIIGFFALSSSLYGAFIFVLLILAIAEEMGVHMVEKLIEMSGFYDSFEALSVGLAVATIIISIPFIRTIYRIMILYRQKFFYQKRLYEYSSEQLSVWQQLSLVKLFSLMVATSIMPLLLGLLIIIFGFALIATSFDSY